MNILLFANQIKTKLTLPITIYDNLIFDKANSVEIKYINRMCGELLSGYSVSGKNPFCSVRYLNHRIVELKEPKYWVIRHEEDEIKPIYIPLFSLLPQSLQPTYQSIKIQEDLDAILTPAYVPNKILEFSESLGFTDVKSTDITLLKKLFKHVDNLDETKHKFIIDSIFDYETLYHIPNQSDLKIVGLFGIVEKLITSRKSIQMNSINFQLQNKINLLNNRHTKPIDFFERVNTTDTLTIPKIIEKLYTFRSNIAHGDKPDFENKLSILKSDSNAKILIEEICKMVLIRSILESDLVIDLRKC